MIRSHYIFFLCFLLITFAADAQYQKYSNLKRKKIAASGIIQLDSLSIVPQSIHINGIDTSYYFIDNVTATFTWKKPTSSDSILITYRTFPFRFDATTFKYDYDSIRNTTVFTPYVVTPSTEKPSTSLFDFGDINYNGSFGRSLSFGNNQDAVLNSQLNLQMNGFIGDSIEIAAAITDNNIPIQPDGTTQQLNEFDKILIQFRKKDWEVSLGDIDIRQNQSFFLNFYKRLQGISYQQTNKIGRDGSNKLLVSGAIAKGKFTRNIFQGSEGNQGPYRLEGANNEFFFIVLAGTERIYIDGELMQRGEDQDYVINYNTAEVTFTPRRMITKDRRIQIEFEYADRNFLNSMLYGSNEMVINKRLKGFISVYSNNDAKNSPINQTLDAPQKQFLSNIGDSIQSAFYPVSALDSFSTSKILYKKIDTVYNSIIETIYVYSTSPDSAKYNLNFLEVGQGRGNYVPLFNAANGKVYVWIEPVNGIKQGNFEPAAFLVTPKKQQVISGGLTYQIDSKTVITTEAAVSNYDANTYSTKDQSDNKGVAGKFSLHRSDKWKSKTKTLSLITSLGYEYVQQHFRSIERLRPVEFGRDWGLGFLYNPADEHLPFISLKLADEKNNAVQYTFSSYLRSDKFKAYRHSFQQFNDIKGWQIRSAINLTNNNSPMEEGFFFRPSVELSKKLVRFNNFIVGGSFSREHNEQRNKFYDTLNPLSFQFDIVSAFIKSNPEKDNRWSFSYFTRKDKLPFTRQLLPTDISHNYNFTLDLLQSSKHQLRSTVTYRQLEVSNKSVSNLSADNSLLGRVEYMINEWKGLLTGSVLYELGAGQEQRRDFSYIEVPAGRGEFAWNDYNADGIPQLNEFEVALFPDQAKYIRIFTPTNQFIKANYTQFNYSFNIDPRAIAENMKDGRWKNLITRFNIQSSMQTAKKVLSDGHPLFNPFKGNITDESLVTLNYILSNTISFNRFSTRWGLDATNIMSFNKALLTYGVESRQLNDWMLKARMNISRQYTFEFIQRFGTNNLITPKFSNRNYELETYTTEPRITFTEFTKYRVQASYQFIQKKNAMMYGGEKALSNVFTLESKFNAVQNTSVTGRFSYNNISYNGAPNTTTSYIMLDGLLPGKNLLWMADFTKRLANNLELSFQYEGRKPADTRTIHIGRASIRALL